MSELLDRAIRLGLGIAYRRIFGDTPDDTAQPSSPNEVGAVSSMLRLKREDGGVLLNIGRRTSGKTTSLGEGDKVRRVRQAAPAI